MCIWDPKVAALPEKQRCPTAVFWLGWGPGIAVMSPCTPAHPPKWVRCAPRGIYISPTLQSLRLLLSWGKSALNQERTRMQCLTLLFICNDMAKTPAYLRSQMFHTVVYLWLDVSPLCLFVTPHSGSALSLFGFQTFTVRGKAAESDLGCPDKICWEYHQLLVRQNMT